MNYIFGLSLALFFLSGFTVRSQHIYPLEETSGHYQELQKLSPEPNEKRAHLDEIKYPSDRYNSGSLVYLLVPPYYLTTAQIHELKLTVSPPANSSDQTKAELDFLLKWQKERSPEQVRRSVDELAPIGFWPHIDVIETHSRYHTNLDHLFFEGKHVLGPDCTPANYPMTKKLLAGVVHDMRIMEFTVKYHFLRARPYQLSETLAPLAQMQTPSFASGHTLWAYIQAFTWSELVPSKRKEFLEIAYEVGASREIMGIHYPSDEEASRVLAHRMLNVMFENTEFKKDLLAAQREWK